MNLSLLDGVRVLDLTHIVMGPTLTTFLATFGAEVIRVETRKRPDMIRGRQEGRFADLNLNKRSLTVDLTRIEGADIIKKLVPHCDIFAESFSPGVVDKLGLGYNTLKEIRPDLIMVSLSGFGGSGPEMHFRSFAAIFNAMGVVSSITGYPDGLPTIVRRGDPHNGQLCCVAVLAALIHRRRTGEGQHIDFSAVEGTISDIGEVILDYTVNGRVQVPTGNEDRIMAPHNCYPCKGKDRWVTIAVKTDDEWRAFCQAMGRGDLMEDERFRDAFLRKQNSEALDQLISEWTVNHDPFELMEVLQKAGVAAMPSFNNADLYNSKHLKERGFIQEINHPQLGKRVAFGMPWRISGEPVPVKRGPLIGEDNNYVLGQILKMSEADIVELEAKGVLY